MYYLAEISCAINGIFIAEKLVFKLFKEKESKALTIFGKFLYVAIFIFRRCRNKDAIGCPHGYRFIMGILHGLHRLLC